MTSDADSVRVAIAAIGRIPSAKLAHAYNDLGQWVRVSKYELSKEEWVWLNQSHLSVLRRQAGYGGVSFFGVLAATHVKFSLNGGPPRRLPLWGRWGAAGVVAWMVSGWASVSGYRICTKRLMLVPDSGLGAHLRAALSLPAPAAKAAATELFEQGAEISSIFVAGEFEQPRPSRGESSAVRDRGALPDSTSAFAEPSAAGELPPDVTPSRRPLPAPTSPTNSWDAVRAARAPASPPNSWDAVRAQRLEKNKLAVAGGNQEQPSQPSQWSEPVGVARKDRDSMIKNRYGDKLLSDTRPGD
ncbi:hypothetical protein T492DRAFT_1013298 [Pavlovales sp. CCMP2436]|nr:hypothetical protein T492DRAFT_1013298 [Pavlovales sp. CCMP2436]|mmetsp:Transcript_43946/g.108758  ORF Transcript_43946/g.108758 Transcript_43946/m.108758 type:complete len:300 (-) Transcript_43946:139-1038(-)